LQPSAAEFLNTLGKALVMFCRVVGGAEVALMVSLLT